jgi:hypothetical protein
MKRIVLLVCVVAGAWAVGLPDGSLAAGSSCRHAAVSNGKGTSGGCPWKGPLILNSDNDYWIRSSDGHTVLVAHIQTQCRIQAAFTLNGQMTVYPKSVGLVSYQLEDTVSLVTFFDTSGNKLGRKILGFKVVPFVRNVKETGSVTTKLPAAGGTDVMMPGQYHFPALFYYDNNQLIPNAPAATLRCGSQTGKQAKVHLLNRYGSHTDPYTATQMHDSSTVEYPIPTKYKYGPKTKFPEQDLLSAALRILALEYPRFDREKFDPRTVTEMPGNKPGGTVTLGLTRYAIGQANTNEMPMTRPKPCQ